MKNQSYFKNIQVPLIKKHIKHFRLEGRAFTVTGGQMALAFKFWSEFFFSNSVLDKEQFSFYEMK